jgi:hypothetical protein
MGGVSQNAQYHYEHETASRSKSVFLPLEYTTNNGHFARHNGRVRALLKLAGLV